MKTRIVHWISLVVLVIVQVLSMLAFSFALLIRGQPIVTVISAFTCLGIAVVTAAIIDDIKQQLDI